MPSPPGKIGKRHVHPEHAGQHGERQEDRRDDGQRLHHLVQAIRRERQVGVEQRRDPVVEHRRLVGETDQVIVDVTEAVRQRLRDLRELAARQPTDDVALGRDHPAERRHVALEPEDFPDIVRVGLVEDTILEGRRAASRASRPRGDSCRPSSRRCGAAAPPALPPARNRCADRGRACAPPNARSRRGRSPGTARPGRCRPRASRSGAPWPRSRCRAGSGRGSRRSSPPWGSGSRLSASSMASSWNPNGSARIRASSSVGLCEIDPDVVAALRQEPPGLDTVGEPGLPAVRDVNRQHRLLPAAPSAPPGRPLSLSALGARPGGRVAERAAALVAPPPGLPNRRP